MLAAAVRSTGLSLARNSRDFHCYPSANCNSIPQRHRSLSTVQHTSNLRLSRLSLRPVLQPVRLQVMTDGVAYYSIGGLLGTSVLMFTAAYGCGMLPSWTRVSERQMASISAVGAGLLLGSALVIILPEGFEAAMHADEGSPLPERAMSLSLLAGFWFMLVLDRASHMLPPVASSSGSSSLPPQQLLGEEFSHEESDNRSRNLADQVCVDEHVILLGDIQQEMPKRGAASAAVANKLVNSSSGSPVRRLAPPATNSDQGDPASGGLKSGSDSSSVGLVAGWLRDPSQQALLGLIVHAASDGLAVGASALSSEPAVSFSVAAAMVVHKGPVAVGLSTYLRSAHWSPGSIHKGILLFAATSPVAALLTYCAMSALPFMSTASNIPLAILFSGGTVLYAATMHILPSALEGHLQHQHGPSVGGAVGSSKLGRSQQQQSSKKQLLLVSAGMLLPLVLSAISTHEH